MAHNRVTLITGGSRSGKSAHALELATMNGGADRRLFFIATAEALDAEMVARISHHRATRASSFHTLEEPLAVSSTVRELEGRASVVVLDCLTLWVSNLMGSGLTDDAILAEAEALAQALSEASFASFIVTDEVGSGIVPEHPSARRFRDLLGWTNQRIGKTADSILLMVAGQSLRVK